MNILQDGFRYDAIKQWVANLLLIALMLRALVPVGYMPDFAAAAKGEYKVVICSAAGSKTISLDADGIPVPADPSEQHDQPCAFAGVLAFAGPALEALTISPPATALDIGVPRQSAELPPARAGPVLGSRGPPQNS